jgi:hypothetical protein
MGEVPVGKAGLSDGSGFPYCVDVLLRAGWDSKARR